MTGTGPPRVAAQIHRLFICQHHYTRPGCARQSSGENSEGEREIIKSQLEMNRLFLAGAEGFEPSTKVLETRTLPLHHTTKHLDSSSADIIMVHCCFVNSSHVLTNVHKEIYRDFEKLLTNSMRDNRLIMGERYVFVHHS